MPIKFFQKTQLANGAKTSIEKLQKGDSVLTASWNGNLTLLENEIAEENGIFPKKPWLGYKISWKGGHIFCTENMPFFVNDFQAIPAKLLNVNEHQLINKQGEHLAITGIENGRVLCGQKNLLTNAAENSINGHAILLEGVFVGDSYVEDLVKNTVKVEYANKAIFPGNAVARAFRLLMMRMQD
ncbi:MAG: hypothetical protein KDC92_02890 [Bacteroidetes bacterium]|nr:hypothetical protein [Bacteroidota bacterium]